MQIQCLSVRSNNQAISKDVLSQPVSELDEYRSVYNYGLHGLIRTAKTVWTVKGIIESNQEVWDKLNVWSGPDENGKQVKAIFAGPDLVDNLMYLNHVQISLSVKYL
ncbi:MAG: hypothetical protein JWM44_4323 [Bacilli bacterium]|nr:hypothetical protein [Bacilli bacterium]